MVASFKRMQRFKDFGGIQAALETSELLELNPQKTQVRRKVPLDLNIDYDKIKEIRDKTQSRSLYAVSYILVNEDAGVGSTNGHFERPERIWRRDAHYSV